MRNRLYGRLLFLPLPLLSVFRCFNNRSPPLRKHRGYTHSYEHIISTYLLVAILSYLIRVAASGAAAQHLTQILQIKSLTYKRLTITYDYSRRRKKKKETKQKRPPRLWLGISFPHKRRLKLTAGQAISEAQWGGREYMYIEYNKYMELKKKWLRHYVYARGMVRRVFSAL